MGYFIYNRKSQEDDGRQVQSIGDQDRLNHELAERLCLGVAGSFDEAMSAKRPGRPVFNDILDRIERGEGEGIIAWHPDRLSRNAVDAGRIIDLLDTGPIADLKFQSYTFENTPEGKWMLQIVLSQSKYFVDKLSKDVNRGLMSKIDKGHLPARALPGYVNDLLEHTISVDPERFVMLRRAIDLLLTGAYPPSQVLAILNGEWGFRTRRTRKTGGGPLSRSVFYNMLSNPFYAGQLRYRGELRDGKHTPIMSMHEFNQLQQLTRKGKLALQPQRHEFDFTGLIRCGLCGCQVTAERKVKHYQTTGNTREYVYYHCTNSKGGCRKVSVSEAQIEGQVSGLLSRIEIDPAIRDWCLGPAGRWFRQETGLGHAALDDLLKALAMAERKKTVLMDDRLLDPGLYTTEEFREQKERVQAEINSLRTSVRQAEEKLEQDRRTVENVLDFAVNAPRCFREGGLKARKEIAKQLGAKYTLTLGKLEIEPHPLLVPMLAFEPLKNGSHNEKDPHHGDESPSWQYMLDGILSLVKSGDHTFPRLQEESSTSRTLPC